MEKYLKGGKSEGMSLKEVAKIHKMNAEQLKPQLQKGIKHELEHTSSIVEARTIALDHLVEFPDYYDRLDKIEKMKSGGLTIAQTSAPMKDRVHGSKTNSKGSASDSDLAKSIKFNESLEKAIQNKVDEYNEEHPKNKVSLATAKAVVRRGMGAYSKSHRPTISGGAPNSRQAWGLARLNKFLIKKSGGKVKSAYIQDDDLLGKYEHGGEVVAKNEDIRNNFNKMDKEVKHNMGKAGGYLVGRRHTEGGIKAINKSTGQPLEMEGGEVVITRNAVSDDTKREFEGEMLTNREILSQINQSGGGVSFEDGGEITYCGKQYNYGGQMMTDHDILNEMALGGELMEMDSIEEFEYGGDISDFKLKNGIVVPTQSDVRMFYVRMYDDPMKLTIQIASTYVRGSGRIRFSNYTRYEFSNTMMLPSYNYVDKKTFTEALNLESATPAIKAMLIPDIAETKAMYDNFNYFMVESFKRASVVTNSINIKQKYDFLVGDADFQKGIKEFWNEYSALEPLFTFDANAPKKKATRKPASAKFQYGVESIKFDRLGSQKQYSNKTINNDGNNYLVTFLNEFIDYNILNDPKDPNSGLLNRDLYEFFYAKKLNIKLENIDETIYGQRVEFEYELYIEGKNYPEALNKSKQYGLNKIKLNNLENRGASLLMYTIFRYSRVLRDEKNGYTLNISQIYDYVKGKNFNLNLPVSINDYCVIVNQLMGLFKDSSTLIALTPVFSLEDERNISIPEIKKILNWDDATLDQYSTQNFYEHLKLAILYYRAFMVSKYEQLKESFEMRNAQNLQVGDYVEFATQEAVGYPSYGQDINGDVVRGQVIAIGTEKAFRSEYNPNGTIYTVKLDVEAKDKATQRYFEAKDVIKLDKPTGATTEQVVVEETNAPKPKIKRATTNMIDVDKNIYDLQYLISLTSDFDFETKLQLRKQLTDFQKVKNLMFASQSSEELVKNTIPNYDGKYAISIIEKLLNADSIDLRTRPTMNAPALDGFQPNGDETMLDTFNYQLIQTEMFKEWFGDYNTAYDFRDLSGYDNVIPVSKVMTKGYEPLVVYQGLGRAYERERFDQFPTSYFAVNYNYAEWFATIKGQRNGTDGYILPFFLNIRNPLDFTYFGIDKVAPKDFFDYLYVKTGQTAEQLGFDARFLQPNVPAMEVWAYIRNSPRAITTIAQQGIYDGFHFYENNPQATGNQYQTEVWTTFFANQTKLASNERSEMLYSANQGFLMAKGGLIK